MNERTAHNKLRIPPGYGYHLFLVIGMYLLFFEEPVARFSILLPSIFRNLLPVFAVIIFIRNMPDKDLCRYLFRPALICGLIFSVSGMAGYFFHHYQTLGLTVRGMIGHVRFWLCLYFFIEFCRHLDIRRYARRLFIHTAILSTGLSMLSFLDFFLRIWPRQIYRWGIGSIQLFFGHPSNLGARAVFLIAMLTILVPQTESFLPALGRILTICLLIVTLMTLRIRLFGFVVFFVIIYLFVIVLKKDLKVPVIMAGGAGALLVGGKRLYSFYLSSYSVNMARGRMMATSLVIANENAPFGSGFSTFGSRLAQIHYSPLYFKYNLASVTGLSPTHPNYACDAFLPVVIGESGWLGTAAYAGLLLCLLIRILHFRQYAGPRQAGAFTAAFSLFVYEVFETAGTLAFSETYAVLITLALGLAIALCEDSHREDRAASR